MQICDTFGLSFLHTLVSIIFPTGNACVPADESPPCKPEIKFHVMEEMYAALRLCTCAEKTTFLGKDD